MDFSKLHFKSVVRQAIPGVGDLIRSEDTPNYINLVLRTERVDGTYMVHSVRKFHCYGMPEPTCRVMANYRVRPFEWTRYTRWRFVDVFAPLPHRREMHYTVDHGAFNLQTCPLSDGQCTFIPVNMRGWLIEEAAKIKPEYWNVDSN